MSDTMLLYMGIFVFSMMAVGLALTMFEFRTLRSREARTPRDRKVQAARGTSHQWHGSDVSGKVSNPETVPHGT